MGVPEREPNSIPYNRTFFLYPPVNIADAKGNSLPMVYICSVLAAGVGETFTYPLDNIKTHLHIQGEASSQIGTTGKRAGALEIAANIFRVGGIPGLYSGFIPMMIRHSIYSGIRLISYDYLRSQFKTVHPDGKVTVSLGKSILASALAGAIGACMSNFADIVKVQKQVEMRRRVLGLEPIFPGVPRAFYNIVAQGGVKGLFKGLSPNILRAVTISIGEISGYDITKRFLLNRLDFPDNFLTHTVASLNAGFLATILSTPADVMKSRIMNQPVDGSGKGTLYKGLVDCLVQTVSKEGPLALYKGVIPLGCRMGPYALLFWLSFEKFRVFFGGTSY